MSGNLQLLIEEAIKLELNVSRAYRNFHRMFHQDAEFWWRLSIEENNHAALLESGKRSFLVAGMFPAELVGNSLEALINANHELQNILKDVKVESPSRAAALNIALNLEELAGEIHFQNAIQKIDHPSDAIKLFQTLNKNDKDHTGRIRKYMILNDIE